MRLLCTLLGFMALAAVANADTGPPSVVAMDQNLSVALAPNSASHWTRQPPGTNAWTEGTAALGTLYQGEATVALRIVLGDGIFFGAAPTNHNSTALLMTAPDEEGNGWATTQIPPEAAVDRSEGGAYALFMLDGMSGTDGARSAFIMANPGDDGNDNDDNAGIALLMNTGNDEGNASNNNRQSRRS